MIYKQKNLVDDNKQTKYNALNSTDVEDGRMICINNYLRAHNYTKYNVKNKSTVKLMFNQTLNYKNDRRNDKNLSIIYNAKDYRLFKLAQGLQGANNKLKNRGSFDAYSQLYKIFYCKTKKSRNKKFAFVNEKYLSNMFDDKINATKSVFKRSTNGKYVNDARKNSYNTHHTVTIDKIQPTTILKSITDILNNKPNHLKKKNRTRFDISRLYNKNVINKCGSIDDKFSGHNSLKFNFVYLKNIESNATWGQYVYIPENKFNNPSIGNFIEKNYIVIHNIHFDIAKFIKNSVLNNFQICRNNLMFVSNDHILVFIDKKNFVIIWPNAKSKHEFRLSIDKKIKTYIKLYNSKNGVVGDCYKPASLIFQIQQIFPTLLSKNLIEDYLHVCVFSHYKQKRYIPELYDMIFQSLQYYKIFKPQI
ncbi:hypothetical protein COBT_001250 [Conglomerata obtusa]